MRSADKKWKSTCEIKNQETCRPVGHCLDSNPSAEICHTHTLRRYQSSYNLVQLIHKNTARSKYKNRGLKNLPRSSLAILRKINVQNLLSPELIHQKYLRFGSYLLFHVVTLFCLIVVVVVVVMVVMGVKFHLWGTAPPPPPLLSYVSISKGE